MSCSRQFWLIYTVHDALEKMSDSNVSRDVIEELVFIEDQAKQNISAWKAHLLRCINQDEVRLEMINALDEARYFWFKTGP